MNQKKGILLIFCTALISGLSVFLNKFGVAVIAPYIFTGLKNIVVALLISSLIFLIRKGEGLKEVTFRKWLLLIGVGLVGGSVPFLLFFKGLSLTTASQAAFIHKTMFLYVFLLAAFILKEKISFKVILSGFLLLFANLLLLKSFTFELNLGVLLIFIATLFWALENTLSKYLLRDLSSEMVIWARMFFGSLFIILFWLLTGQVGALMSLNLMQIGWVLITSVLLFAYVASWYSGLKYVNLSTASVILLLAGPITMFLENLSSGDFIRGEWVVLLLSGLSVFILLEGFAKYGEKAKLS